MAGFLFGKIGEPIGHAGTGFRGGLKDADARTDLIDVLEGRLAIESARSAISILVRIAASAELNSVGYLSGLSSPSVTLSRATRIFSPRS